METKTKTKAAMLTELESIKGLLQEEDDIPILQEVMDSASAMEYDEIPSDTLPSTPTAALHEITTSPETKKNTTKTVYEEQQDFFHSFEANATHAKEQHDLLDALSDLESKTTEVTTHKLLSDAHKTPSLRTSLTKASGENPFLPEHIRARLHGNNPPPLFANETARKIAGSSTPSRLLGSLSAQAHLTHHSAFKSNHPQQDLIDSIIQKIMPDIEKELRHKLELMTRSMLDELNRH